MQFSSCIGLPLANNNTDLDSLLTSWRAAQPVVTVPIVSIVETAVESKAPIDPDVALFWDSKTVIDGDHMPELPIASVSPKEEILRQEAIQRLRNGLDQLCSEASKGALVKVDAEVFDKWQFKRLEAQYGKGDSLLPTGAGDDRGDQGLHEDLMRLCRSLNEKSSRDIVAQLDQLSRIAAQKMENLKGAKQEAVVKMKGDVVHVVSGSTLVKVNRPHFIKLQKMFRGDDKQFPSALFTLLLRYLSMNDTGMQAACDEKVFAELHNSFDVRMECFASPLNCYFTRQFCSLFPDTDASFGSLGSFFHFKPTCGSFEANPPFIDDIIARMSMHMNRLLKATTLPLSFVVIVPARKMTSAWRTLRKSPFNVNHILLKQSDHGFCEGAQHRRDTRYKVSSCDTSVFFMQNAAGAIAYAVSDEKIERLRSAFRSKQAGELKQQLMVKGKRKRPRQ